MSKRVQHAATFAILLTAAVASPPVGAATAAHGSHEKSAWPAPDRSVAAGDVLRATLQNGLRVVIVRNTLAPVVSTSINYLVGADETPPGFPGTAHAQEHMMFRGSPGLSADQLADIGNILGGDFNADTQQSVTQYLYTIPAKDLDIALHIEALRMRGVDDTEASWEKERGAIKQEVAMDLSQPSYRMYVQLRRAFFGGTPYENDALGSRPSFDRTTGAMLKQFYDRWYVPNNAIVVIAGDVDPTATLAMVRKLFGDIPGKTLPARPAIRLPAVSAESIRMPSDLPYGMQVVAFRMPGFDSSDYAACEVLADVLSSKRGALYQLVPQGKAFSAEFDFDPLKKASLGYTTVTYAAGADPAAVQRDVRAILARVAREGVPADLVAAAKMQERRAADQQKSSIEGLAGAWADAVAVEGLSSPDEDLARIEKVTVADVNRVARKYLVLDRSVSAVLTPAPNGKPVSGAGFGGQESIALGEGKPTPLPEWAQRALTRLSVPDLTTRPVVDRLRNGITLIVQPETVGDSVSVYGHIRNRPEMEAPKGQEGVATVLDSLFSYGSTHLDRLAFQRALDAIGADESAGSEFDVTVLRDHFARAVQLLADNELHPALPPAAFRTVRAQTAQAVAGELKSPGYQFGRALAKALFPKGDPSTRQATPQSVSALTLADVKRYYGKVFRPDMTVIVVIGRIDPRQAKEVVERYFGGWQARGPRPETTLPRAPANRPSTVAVADASRVQVRAVLGETTGLVRSSPDYYAVALGNAVLGGGFYSARLSSDIRKNAGLVYYIGSEFQAGKSRSAYVVRYACDPQNVSKVHASVVREIQVMQKTPVSPGELLRAKQLLLRRIPLSEASTDAIARQWIARWDLDLPLNEPELAARRYIDLSAQDIRSAFAKWLRPTELVQVTQGPTPR